ncbi:hypothetical protein OHA72_54135 [Dactylosporangium sp. NBC_01737]|uniref:hypothetical protein n=1 Tax=Dactylosporangium sp. NBC_01737 TaxID=2975959 RepID=UPI002E100639|nr:hypothetical protein OHA72_54135 [Dactylosporangium sp. NBC_01737]
MSDPYGQLFEGYEARRREFIRRATTDPLTFVLDPVRNGVAIRRGYLRGDPEGRPSATIDERDAAMIAYGQNLVTWRDNPAVRADSCNPFEIERTWMLEDGRTTLLRLAAFGNRFPLPFADPLPTRPGAAQRAGATRRADTPARRRTAPGHGTRAPAAAGTAAPHGPDLPAGLRRAGRAGLVRVTGRRADLRPGRGARPRAVPVGGGGIDVHGAGARTAMADRVHVYERLGNETGLANARADLAGFS